MHREYRDVESWIRITSNDLLSPLRRSVRSVTLVLKILMLVVRGGYFWGGVAFIKKA